MPATPVFGTLHDASGAAAPAVRADAARLSGVTKRTVRGIGAALGMSAALGLTGCAYLSPVQTQVSYQPADGIAVDLGPVQVHNLLVVAPAKGGPGTVSASIVNNSGQEVAVAFTDATSGATVKVAAAPGVATPASVEGNTVELASVSGAPGSNITMNVTTPLTGTAQVAVPVLSAQSFYQTLLPTPIPTAATPAPATARATPTS